MSPSERGLAWRFLFGMYPCGSTALERSLLQEQMVVRYQVMKKRWQRFLPSAVQIHLNGTDGETANAAESSPTDLKWLQASGLLCSPAELVAAVRFFNQRQARVQQQTQDQSEEIRERMAFLELQAQVGYI